MTSESFPSQPSLPWRTASSITVGLIGSLSRLFLYVASTTETHGLDRFLELLDKRRAPEMRERGLITVSNHMSVLDDPMIWGVLPFSYSFNPTNHRWSLGSYDLCFQNKFTSLFFTLGQVLPTHRLAHSPHGGLFQPTMTQAVRLLSKGPFASYYPMYSPGRVVSLSRTRPADPSFHSPDLSDPFSGPHLTYTTNGLDTFPAPASYSSRAYSWIHVFPEGRVHQHPHKTMRYFKWGVARLILEPDVCPDIVPMWIEGPEEVMHESRKFPRFLPRVGKKIQIWFGDNVGGETGEVFEECRRQWRRLVEEEEEKRKSWRESQELRPGRRIVEPRLEMGELSEELKFGKEAAELRKEVTRRVRMEVLRVRRMRGLPDEDPKEGLRETWVEEGAMWKREGRMGDGSWVKEE